MRPLPLLVLIVTLAFAAMGYLVPFDGYDSGQVPIPQVDPPIQPAGWAFSIWGLIYAWLAVSGIYGLWRRADDPDWDRVRSPLLASLMLGTGWLFIASTSAVWATVVIFLMAGAAVSALLGAPARDRWLLQAPVALYAGWLTAASFVSLGSTMAGWGVLTGPLGWAFIGLPLALVTAMAVQADRPRAPEYGIAVAWALFGIAVKNGMERPGVTLLAVAGIASVLTVAWAGRRTA
ncbi:hypothetical protein FHG66_00690 [Rubellimicrobium rubrum]|uniref:Tryptophan-rich sensory protein n=1 Tax=Rubellimicrobium rubrum TaxID=2585369 RepID=A0A5C4N3H4_9RHOB|nr:hypothetical protein [Rubellimicrobium rubrum]TNC52846.1 hypothetical protein FHG66_00690 [Rubellimicrobium rubrum]